MPLNKISIVDEPSSLPDQLPVAPSFNLVTGIVREGFTMVTDGGYTYTKNRFSRSLREVNLTWSGITEAQKDLLVAFFETNEGGIKSFLWESRRWHLDGELNTSKDTPNSYSASIDIREVPTNCQASSPSAVDLEEEVKVWHGIPDGETTNILQYTVERDKSLGIITESSGRFTILEAGEFELTLGLPITTPSATLKLVKDPDGTPTDIRQWVEDSNRMDHTTVFQAAANDIFAIERTGGTLDLTKPLESEIIIKKISSQVI